MPIDDLPSQAPRISGLNRKVAGIAEGRLAGRMLRLVLPAAWARAVWFQVKWMLGRIDPELTLARRILHRDSVAVDVGANIGVWAEGMARTGARVHAMEPHPWLAAWLQKGTRRRVTVHAIALGDFVGDATLTVPVKGRTQTSGHGTLARGGTGDEASFAVKCRRLDDMAIGNVDVLKVDTEGLEEAVLAGAQWTVARSLPCVILEINEGAQGQRYERIARLLHALGYEAYHARGNRARARFERIDATATPTPGSVNYVFIHPNRRSHLTAMQRHLAV